MRRRTRWVVRGALVTSLFALALAGIVLFQYATAASLGGVSPSEGQALRTSQVLVRAELPGYSPGEGEVRILIDGRPLPDKELAELEGAVQARPHLADGNHRVVVELRTSNLFARRLELASSFTVDTKAPLVSELQPAPDSFFSEAAKFRASFDESVEAILLLDGERLIEGQGPAWRVTWS